MCCEISVESIQRSQVDMRTRAGRGTLPIDSTNRSIHMPLVLKKTDLQSYSVHMPLVFKKTDMQS